METKYLISIMVFNFNQHRFKKYFNLVDVLTPITKISVLNSQKACQNIKVQQSWSDCSWTNFSAIIRNMGGSIGGDRGSGPRPPPPPLKNHKNIGFPSNNGQEPQKITKLPSQHSMVGHYWHANVLLGCRWRPTFSSISILSPSHPLKKKRKKNCQC